MLGEVKEWKMTEEERLAYIAKHPIKRTVKPNGSSFSMTSPEFKERQDRARKARWGYSRFTEK